ncbi:MAG: DUF3501 family protein [Paludibacterium sp.]|uniref:DUF3501 family protein n=1 Tax=Paludibacterium sp. TaxID=1917523 RepID=UPI0025F008D0|nr:DUF3501 family protein [Paludibacterium sp.]MBV8048973.1 DUF3501 family protein [Paludibacterium sp.]MBV8646583.1 DUF3501 family protein [Paludibacterium sp.]
MLTHEQLFSLEQYARIRPEFRARVIAHKKERRLPLGEHAALYFEDTLTMQYQIQEMLRLERMFEPELIQQELDVYNPLIPDGSNWKATFMLEYPDAEARKAALARLTGIETHVWLQVGDHPKIRPVANEDLDRTTGDKTSAVHFLRFELTPAMVAAAKSGATLCAGIDHPHYQAKTEAAPAVRVSLAGDLR